MLEKLVFFGIGYLIGARAGRERFDELVEMARGLAQRDEVKMAIGLVQGLVESRLEAAGSGLRLAA